MYIALRQNALKNLNAVVTTLKIIFYSSGKLEFSTVWLCLLCVLDQNVQLLYQSTKTWEFILVFLNGKIMLWSCSKLIDCTRHNWRKCKRLAYISIHWHCQYVLMNEKAGEIWRSLTSNFQHWRDWSINLHFSFIQQRLDYISDYPTQSVAEQLWGVFKRQRWLPAQKRREIL